MSARRTFVLKPLVVVVLCLFANHLRADIKLPAVFGDNMVLQRGMTIPVWGWASPGEKVAVAVGDRTAEATADATGRWRLAVEPMAAGGPFELTVSGRNTVTLRNVLVGEVWVASGQSNMAMGLAEAADGKAEAAAAADPGIRVFRVENRTALRVEADCAGAWAVCDPKVAGGVSAVAYYFARKLRKELDVPVGLIQTAWGGTGAESWMSMDGLCSVPVLRQNKDRIDATILKAEAMPRNSKEDDTDWMSPALDETTWKSIVLPLYWDYELFPVEYDGVIWARRSVDIPAAWNGQPLRLTLKVDDYETTYFNGVEIGRTTAHTLALRAYEVPGNLVTTGKAVVAVRTAKRGWGGIVGNKDELRLSLVGTPDAVVSLAGEWKYRPAELEFKSFSPRLETSLYNGMVAPLVPYGMRGVIWYQGEANANTATAVSYREIFPALIRNWRGKWGQGDFPFYYVQLANFETNGCWPDLRESQLRTLSVPNTGMAVAIDIGDPKDIHPKNKRDVGERLALWALAKNYGKALEYSGPLYERMTVENGKARVAFTHTTGGLVVKGGGDVKYVEIAGADGKFVPAEARLDGEILAVSSPAVAAPVAVRYAWRDNPEGCNLYNGAGLPASPFRAEVAPEHR